VSALYELIHSEESSYPIPMMLRLLEVSKSGYYNWVKRRSFLSKQAQRRQRRDHLIKVAFAETKGRYGSPRLTQYLKAQGRKVCENTISESMRRLGLSALCKPRKVKTTDSHHQRPTAENLLAREFNVRSSKPAWVGDITYLYTAEGWLYLASLIKLQSRRVIGWALSDTINEELVTRALEMALSSHTSTQGVLHHSDRGAQYCARGYQEKLKSKGFIISMSAPGECLDNAVAESFFGQLKRELPVKSLFKMKRSEARREVSNYIHWYNSERLHSSLDHMSPLDFERQLKAHSNQPR